MQITQYSQGYLQHPTLNIKNDSIIFTCDDDLWRVPVSGGQASRLTNSKGVAHCPMLSPSGKCVAYLATDCGQSDLYIMDSAGGIPKRLTFSGVHNFSGWENDKTLIYSSNSSSFSPRVSLLYSINIDSLEITDLNLGHASTLSSFKKKRLLGRNIGDPARWKRYRGGTAGTLWLNHLDGKNKGEFKQILKSLKSNLANPLWIDHSSVGKVPRIFFISDHEGIGNIYSCNHTGSNILRHTHSRKYYIRNFSYDQGTIVYQAGADLFTLDLITSKTEALHINIPSAFNQATPRVEDAEDFLQEYTLHKEASKIALIARGQLFIRTPWSNAPIHLGDSSKRYKHPTFVQAKNIDGVLAVELNEENEETIKFFSYDKEKNQYDYKGVSLAPKHSWGKIVSLIVHPKKDIVTLSNNRNELYILAIKTRKVQKIASNPFQVYNDMNWSPCGHLLAYSEATSKTTQAIKVYNLKDKKAQVLIPSVLHDSSPYFDPNGEYLYFIGIREFHPSYSETHFDLGFPFASRVYCVALQNDLPSPLELFENFDLENEQEQSDEEDLKKNIKAQKLTSKTKTTKKPTPSKKKEEITIIDWKGIESRIVSLPVPLGGYREIACVENKLFILKESIKAINPVSPEPSQANLYTFCLKEKKWEIFQRPCESFELSVNGKFILMESEHGLRLTLTEGKPSDGEEYSKKDGYIDLSNIRLFIDPKKEWMQMYQEAWILQREHFWNEEMNKIDWKEVYLRYLPLLDKVNTRREFSDLIWEMQGELGTSHCYEFGGDYHRKAQNHSNGQLGATLKWNSKDNTYTITDLPKGDSWIPQSCSPLRQAGVDLNEGDLILGIDGRYFSTPHDLDLALIGRNGKKVQLIIKRKSIKEKYEESIEIIAHAHHHLSRYRDWVNKNKEYVNKKSKGKIGYVHIPDMSVHGLSEFYRNFLSESTKEGLIVDVRYNGGGNVSQHILKILAQKVIGFDKTRYMDIETYPTYAINGPIVALTNEHAGSDGDIFSHSFKLMNIGPLIGKRTWGGVVGIWPRHPLNDGTITSQPEFSFWFKDVGYQVENYGTDPDIEVENTPEDWAKGLDQQLERAIVEVTKLSKKSPPLRPNLNKGIPNLKAPKLPKLQNK